MTAAWRGDRVESDPPQIKAPLTDPGLAATGMTPAAAGNSTSIKAPSMKLAGQIVVEN